MFIDLTGFTRLTERMMEEGPEGAEKLSYTLNRIFQPMVTLVYEQGGMIPYFAGDSFTALFPFERHAADKLSDVAARICFTVKSTLNRFLDNQNGEDDMASLQIGAKIGLGQGEVEWGIVGPDKNRAFYFRGDAVDFSALAQLQCGNMEVIAHESFQSILGALDLPAVSLHDGYVRVDQAALKNIPVPKPLSIKLPEPDPDLLTDFYPEAVFLEQASAGEFRNVVSAFISFEGVDTHEALQHFIGDILEQCRNFGGYLKEVDFGDKGGVVACFFGAPVSYENNLERALEFASALQDTLSGLQRLTGARYRIGMTAGTAFTGVIGGTERCQYAAVGARVNLAARLMAKAQWGEVLADENVQRNRNFKFQFRGEVGYKGFENNIPTHALTGRNLSGRTSYSGAYYGRQEELQSLLTFAQPLREGRFAGVAHVFGEAGMGKSRLSYEFRRQLRESMEVSWYTCQSDQILRKSFNPFIYFLKNYFEQSPENSPERNRELFESNFLELTYDLTESNHAEADAVRREITRTQSVLAAMVGLQYPGSLWEQLDARGRYQNGLSAMSNFFVAEALIQPVVIELEDTHWYDDMSREFLVQFIRRAQQHPVLFLASSRYEDDGSKNYPVRKQTLEEMEVPTLEIDLNFLSTEDLRGFAEARLGGTLHPDLFELLQRMTQGNPFYLEQMAEYFSEADLLTRDTHGVMQLKDQDIQLSDSVKQIMMARIDRLSGLVKETVKAAAVIGREFELSVLSAIMARQEEFARKNGDLDLVLREQVQTAEKWQIWHAMNELRYIFRHSLLREAAYDMQLRTRLRELHQLIAEAIETLYPDSAERYVDLAFHYEQAEITEKTNYYLEKAAENARRNFQNRSALKYFGKLIYNLSESAADIPKLVKTYLRRGSVQELIGQWDEAASDFQEALRHAENIGDNYLCGRSHRQMGYLRMLRGDYVNAQEHLDHATHFFGQSSDSVGMAKAYGNMGTLFFRQGRYEEAKSWFYKAIEINRSVHRESANADIVANLGLIFMNQGHYDEGIRWLEEQLDIAEHGEDKQAIANLYTNLGIIYLEKNSLDSALLCLEKGLNLSEELGNKLLQTICIGSIGSVWEKKGDYTKAMQNFERDLALCRELGDKQGLAIASSLIGDLLAHTGDFDRSLEYLQQTLSLSRELNYKKGIAKTLNTMGDTLFFKGDHTQAIRYYGEAIEVARDMGNRLVLGNSLIEKGIVHLHAGEISTARMLHDEGREIAVALGNADLTFGANILRAQILIADGNPGEAQRQLQQLLHLARSEREEAAVHFELRKVADAPTLHHNRALQLYRDLYQRTPQYFYKMRLDELER